MTIRLMQTEDYDAVFALWKGCTGMGLNDFDDTFEGVARFLRRNPSTCFVAEEGGETTGVILTGHDGRRAHIYHAAVRPDHRGKGIGRALVETALAALKAEGIAKVSFVAFARNEDGNAFWDHMDFTRREDLVYRDKVLIPMTRTDT